MNLKQYGSEFLDLAVIGIFSYIILTYIPESYHRTGLYGSIMLILFLLQEGSEMIYRHMQSKGDL